MSSRPLNRCCARPAGPFTLLRNDWYHENYTDQLGQYLEQGVIVAAVGTGRVLGAPRRDYAAGGVAALLADDQGEVTYELGGTAFDVTELAAALSEVSDAKIVYRDLSVTDLADRVAAGRP